MVQAAVLPHSVIFTAAMNVGGQGDVPPLLLKPTVPHGSLFQCTPTHSLSRKLTSQPIYPWPSSPIVLLG